MQPMSARSYKEHKFAAFVSYAFKDNLAAAKWVDSFHEELYQVLQGTLDDIDGGARPLRMIRENDIVGAGAYRAPGYGLDNLGPDTDTTTLDAWYEEHVIGGPGSFLKVAQGYEDFGRAFRQKFVTEISGRQSSDIKQARAR